MRFSNLAGLSIFLTIVSAQEKVYQGFNSGNTFTDQTAKKQADFEKEFKTASALAFSPGSFNSVRLYTNIQAKTTADPISAFDAALATNTSLLLGIWCSGTDTITNELSALQAAITKHGQRFADLVVGISVGSEDLYRVSESGIKNAAGIGAGPNTIVRFINQTRSALATTALSGKPVGHVDSWSAWANESNSAVVDAADFIGTDLYPYYEKDLTNTIDNAKTIFDTLLKNVTDSAGNKSVWLTETGWPVSGPNFGSAVPSVDNARAYWERVGCQVFGKMNVWWYNLRDSVSFAHSEVESRLMGCRIRQIRKSSLLLRIFLQHRSSI
jgi:glucan endo-1,3-beta-D-glucosidase